MPAFEFLLTRVTNKPYSACFSLPGLFLYLSIVFYGLVAWSIRSIMAAALAGVAIVLSGFLRKPRTA